jgi:cysteine desulfurase
MEAYLDNSATTRCLESVRDQVVKTMMEDYGNPSSKHLKGMESEKYLRDAREQIAKTMKVNEKEIFFTSGGTESNNWALIGAAMANRRAGMHIITTSVEHAAVIQPMMYLKEQGFRITYLPVDRYGRVCLEDLKAAICSDTILVSIMYVNNELGALEPVEEIGHFLKEEHPKILFHVDAIQAYGKYRILPKKIGIDMLSVSGHKIHGPKGVGFLYINEKVKIHPLILGGGQQKGMRSGTDNVPGIAGLGVAAKEAYTDFQEKRDHLLKLKEREIYVSSGSACSSNKKLPVSEVLKEIGMERELLDSTLRFSFGRFNTEEQLDYTIEVLKELLPVLRRYARY